MKNNYFSFVDLALMNKESVEHSGVLIWGHRGLGKTTCLIGIDEQIEEYNSKNPDNPLTVIFATDIEQIDVCDVLILDDFGTKFNKRDFGTTESKEFMKALQEVRTVIPLILISSPSYYMLDKDIRTFFSPAQIVAKSDMGFLVNYSGANFYVPKPSDFKLNSFRSKEFDERTNRFNRSMGKVKLAHAKKNQLKV